MKVVVVLLGSHASGKSTLSRELLGPAKEYYTNIAGEKVRVTFGTAGFSLAGTRKHGSDSIARMDTLRRTVELLLKHSDTVIADGFRCAHVFTDFIRQLPISDLGVLFVHLNLPLELNLRRLMARRRAAGVIEEALPTKTKMNMLRTRKRALGVFDKAQRTYRREPVVFLTLAGELTPGESAARVKAEISKMRFAEVSAA